MMSYNIIDQVISENIKNLICEIYDVKYLYDRIIVYEVNNCINKMFYFFEEL